MICATAFQGQRIAVFGLGRSGLSTCRALAAGGAEVAAWDESDIGRTAAADAGFRLVDLKTAEWSRFAALVLSPGVPLTHPKPHWSVMLARAAGVEIIGDVEIFARERAAACPKAPFVAITGTNGKSTTTALIAHILSTSGRNVQMGGNIGVPILDLSPPALERIHVIELSSYQIDLMPSLLVPELPTPGLNPSIGILINISPDHLDRHGSFENYAAVKARLPAASGFAIVGSDDDASRAILATENARRRASLAEISGGPLKHGLGIENRVIVQRNRARLPFIAGKREIIASLDGLGALRGWHNGQNAATATAACLVLGLTSREIDAGLKTFPGLAHRLENVGRTDGVSFINDSKSTNARSAAHALEAFDCDIYWIAGGRSKEGGITSLKPYFPRITKAYLIGEAVDAFAATLDGQCPVQNCGTLAAAVAQAAGDARATTDREAVVLLSPACASFDQFCNFEARGNAFRNLVSQVPGVEMRKGQS